MFRILSPDLYLNSVLEIGADDFHSLGVRSLLLDVDGTLKDFQAKSFSAEIHSWIRELKKAPLSLCVLSNGMGRRIQRLARQLDIPFVPKALKPLPFGCYAAMRRIGAMPAETAIIGDQIFADVCAGRLAGIKTILVKPVSLKEPWFTAIKRPFERQFLRWLKPNRQLSVLTGFPRATPVQKEHAIVECVTHSLELK